MCIPLDLNILPKTLLKLASPHYKRATKFKSKKFNNTNKASQASYNNKIRSSLPVTTSYATSIKNYRLILHTFVLLFVALTSLLSLSLSCKRSIAQFLRSTVILNLSFLMNDFRLKSLYQKTTKTIFNTKSNISNNKSKLISSSTSLSSTISSTVTIDLKLFSQNYKNNHRTYNNSSKSNKVFLYYTPRDPRLRYFNRQTFLNKHFLAFIIVKSDCDKSDKSQLKITEDLCNYGELIGGYKSILNCNLATKNNNNNNNRSESSDNLISESENNCDCFKSHIAAVQINVDSSKVGDKKILETIALLNDFLQQQLSSILKHTLSYIRSEGFFLTKTGIVV